MPTTHSAFLDLSTFVNELGYACTSETAPLRVGTVLTTSVPFDMTVERVYASLNAAPVGQSVSVDVNINGSTILNNNLQIPIGAFMAETSTFALSLSTYEILKDDILTFDVNSADTGSATGLKIYLMGHRGG